MELNNKDLLTNGIDYLERTISCYHKKDYKGALLFLWSALLLLFKYRLTLINPVLIFTNIFDIISIENNKIAFKTFKKKIDFPTIDYNKIRERLIFSKCTDSLIFNYHHTFNKIRKLRNRTEHFVYDPKENEFLKHFTEIIPFIHNFIETELQEDITKMFKNWDDFLTIKEFYLLRLNELEKHLEEIMPTYTDFKYGAEELQTEECPNCSKGILVPDESKKVMYCKACGYEDNYHQCHRCFKPIRDGGWDTFYEGMDICGDCFDYYSDR